MLGQARRRVFGLSPAEASFARRGFAAYDARARGRLESIGEIFLLGYHASLEETEGAALARRLARVTPELRGFAFEGAAMGLALLDRLTPWRRNRWRSFVEGHGAAHVYMMHVGLGWAFARLRHRVVSHLPQLDPLLGWLAVDGYGFHEGYFNWRHYVRGRATPPRLGGYAARVFDQGLGRSMWFVKGAHVAEIAQTIASFPEARRGDLWSGVGLACTYAGGVGRAELVSLCAAATDYLPHAAQGAAFAAKTRERAGNTNAHTDTACRVLCRLSAAEAAHLTDSTLENLHDEGALPSYEVWRRRIQARFSPEAQ